MDDRPVRAARARDIPAHRTWMIRAYALGLAAGTQVFAEPIGGALFGTGDVRDDLAKDAGWVLNLAVAEYTIRRPATEALRRHQVGREPLPTRSPSGEPS